MRRCGLRGSSGARRIARHSGRAVDFALPPPCLLHYRLPNPLSMARPRSARCRSLVATLRARSPFPHGGKRNMTTEGLQKARWCSIKVCNRGSQLSFRCFASAGRVAEGWRTHGKSHMLLRNSLALVPASKHGWELGRKTFLHLPSLCFALAGHTEKQRHPNTT